MFQSVASLSIFYSLQKSSSKYKQRVKKLFNDTTLWWPRIAIAKKLLLLTNIVNINTKIKNDLPKKYIIFFFVIKLKTKKKEKKEV